MQGTINGYGERCGNANLVSIIPALVLKMGVAVRERRAARAPHRDGHFVAEIVNIAVWPHEPYVGRSAFAHKGGMHVAAVEKAPADLRARRPGDGRQRAAHRRQRALRQGRRAAQGAGARHRPRGRRRARRRRAQARSRTREHRGYHYEAADASFELLLREELAPHEPLFRLESFRVIVEKREDGQAVVEATIKVHVGGERIISTAEGNGPVNALDTALRLAIARMYPHLADIELVNYKVRILDETKGTGAVTRVLIDASDGEESWGTIGVSENIIEASWEALVDSIEFGHAAAAAEDVSALPRPARMRATCGRWSVTVRTASTSLPVRRRCRRAARPAGVGAGAAWSARRALDAGVDAAGAGRARQDRRRRAQLPRPRRGARDGRPGRADPLHEAAHGGDRAGRGDRAPGPLGRRSTTRPSWSSWSGRRCKDVTPAEAADCVAGYTCGNDVTARDLQKLDGQWTRAKSFDTFCPLGPWIVPEAPSPEARVERVGSTASRSSTASSAT